MALTAERKYRLLVELSQRISRTLDLEAVLDDLLQALRSAIAYDAAGVFVLNRAVPLRADGNMIAGMVQIGFDKPLAEDPMLRSGRGIIGHVIRTGETLNVVDVREDPRYIAGRDTTLSELAVPVVSESGVIGCLNVESDARGVLGGRRRAAAVLRERGRALDREGAAPPPGARSSGSRTS
jgi:putative methionine-R-sulfoxide reductase with GAF domain